MSNTAPLTDGSTPRPRFELPPLVPEQRYRPAQSNIPDQRSVRDQLKKLAAEHVHTIGLVPPMPLSELRQHADAVREAAGLDHEPYNDYIAVLLNNEAWSGALARVPYERRLLLIPKCLRVEEKCPAPFDEFGLLCKECGLCSIQDLTVEAERLGYAVLVAEGSAIVTKLIETGKVEAVVGVSCLNVLEKSFPHLEAAAVPGVAIPLLQDDCINTTVDLDQVWDVIHLTADDRTWRLDLDGLRDTVRSWFGRESLDDLLGVTDSADRTVTVARDWLARDGKRWRPYLTTCVQLALATDARDEEPELDADAKRLAVAVECFHKASLIHDDIEDRDDIRYGQPTLHAQYGEGFAINAGDYLLGEGYRLLSELENVAAEAKVAMLQVASHGHLTLCRGQGKELDWARAPAPITSIDVLKIFAEKTAPAFDVALQLGALYGNGDDDVREALASYSEALGVAYQIRDDLDDFDGSTGDSHDLEDLRPSLLLAIAHKKSRDADHELVDRLWRKQASYGEQRAEIDRILTASGAIQKAHELLSAYEEQATRSLRFLRNATLKGLLRRVVGKIFPRTLIEGYCKEFAARNGAR